MEKSIPFKNGSVRNFKKGSMSSKTLNTGKKKQHLTHCILSRLHLVLTFPMGDRFSDGDSEPARSLRKEAEMTSFHRGL